VNITINLLGGLSLYRQGSQVPLPKSKRTRALLAYLVMTKRPHRRDRLCEVFWEYPSDIKGSLRWSLSKIRALVNDPAVERLLADRERVSLQSQYIHIDVDILSQKLREKCITVNALKAMLQELENPLLSSLDLPDQRLFQEWLIAERNEIDVMHCEVVAKLANHIDLSPLEQLNWSRIWLEQDPYNVASAGNLLNKLQNLNYSKEYQRLSSDLTVRFKKAGIQWKREKNNLSVVDETSSRKESLTRDVLVRQKIKFCTAEDGIKIAYASVGEGYPIVKAANWLSHLEHDWNAPIWSPLFRNLAKNHQFIRYDERGNGLSDWDVKDISFDAFTKDLETVISVNKFEKFALLGLSQGASVAIDYAIKHPDRVSHLILFGGYASGWRINADDEIIKQREALITLTSMGWGQDNPAYRQIFSSTFLPSANKNEHDWFNDFQRLTTSPENAARFLSAFGSIDVRHHLANIEVPTLIIHSINDQRIPIESAREMASIIPNAEFIGLNSDGHVLLGREEAAECFVDAIKEFIARTRNVTGKY
jgi:pimeloyl-ACP methyl ester carboxylesterase